MQAPPALPNQQHGFTVVEVIVTLALNSLLSVAFLVILRSQLFAAEAIETQVTVTSAAIRLAAALERSLNSAPLEQLIDVQHNQFTAIRVKMESYQIGSLTQVTFDPTFRSYLLLFSDGCREEVAAQSPATITTCASSPQHLVLALPIDFTHRYFLDSTTETLRVQSLTLREPIENQPMAYHITALHLTPTGITLCGRSNFCHSVDIRRKTHPLPAQVLLAATYLASRP